MSDPVSPVAAISRTSAVDNESFVVVVVLDAGEVGGRGGGVLKGGGMVQVVA